MTIDTSQYLVQTIIAETGILVAVLGFLGRGIYKRLDKIDDRLEPLTTRMSLSEQEIKTLRDMHYKLEEEHKAVHDKIFLKLDNHEKLISDLKK